MSEIIRRAAGFLWLCASYRSAHTRRSHDHGRYVQGPLTPTKTISPAQHAVLDYGVAATFFSLGTHYRGRHNAAAALAFINGALVLGVSMFTDYPGGIWRRIDFKTHRTMDMVQAAVTGIGPLLMGFGGESEAKPFYAQAASEVGVIAMTDWDAGSRR